MELESGQLVSQQYEVVEVLGRGGMGIVYRALDKKLEREVAVKVLLSDAELLSSAFVQRFRREIKLIRQLEHPNVVRLYDFGEMNGTPFMVMEFVRGREVADELEAHGPMAWKQAQRIMLQMLDGLTIAHKLGIVHRDLKPNNLMLTEVGMTADFVKILDFGIAKAVDAAERDTKVTFQTQNQLVGTPSYMAPEQLKQQPVGPTSDVYAAGLIFIELLTGKALLEGTMVEVVARHIDPRPHELPSQALNSPFADFIDRAVSKEPGDRFADAAAMYQALQTIEVDESQMPIGAGTGPMPSLRRKSGPVAPTTGSTPPPGRVNTGDVAGNPAVFNTLDEPHPGSNSKLLPLLIGLVALVLIGAVIFVVMLAQSEDEGASDDGDAAGVAADEATTEGSGEGVDPDPELEAGASGDPVEVGVGERGADDDDGPSAPEAGAGSGDDTDDAAAAEAAAKAEAAALAEAEAAAQAEADAEAAAKAEADAAAQAAEKAAADLAAKEAAEAEAAAKEEEEKAKKKERESKSRTVEIRVETDPARADVSIGGVKCKSPCSADIRRGQRIKITATKAGHAPQRDTILANKDKTVTLKLYRGL